MNQFKEVIIIVTLLSVTLLGVNYSIQASHSPDKTSQPDTESVHGNETAIRVALLLDTSGSMSGLIEQAKSQLWNILNELNTYKIDGETPRILISLYEYGKDRHGVREGYIKKILPFTADMDMVSEELFQLATNGSKEYCGQVLYRSVDELTWGNNESDLRLVYIAGNESINQGGIAFSKACKGARDIGITVNTIFCGERYSGIELGWKQGAEQGNGEYMNINHNQETVYYESPYDNEIQELNVRLNMTFIPMGKKGKIAYDNQARQDLNAGLKSKANVVNRAAYKSSSNYKSESWDLVDAYENDEEVIKEDSNLPDEFKGLSDKEISLRIDEKKQERQEIKDQIKALKDKRDIHVKEQKASQESAPSDLQESIIKSVEKVAKDKNYKK